MRILFAVILSIFAFTAFAQRSEKSDSARVAFKQLYTPTGIRLGVDALALGLTQFEKSFKGWEVNADVDFNRFFLAFEYGGWQRSYNQDTLRYRNNGRYFRAGVDVNFLTQDPERNMFFLGLRYGRSTFDEDFFISDKDPRWGTLNSTFSQDNVPARWFELTTGIKVKMLSWFWMGYTARFKFGLKTGNTPVMLPHDVPGYGRTDKESYWGFNYYLMARIPYRDYPALPPKKKK